jgi:tRNA dimethylallyltransferase
MDSMALYRGMDIGTAKPTVAERSAVAHHLVDVLDPWESASVGWWLKQAELACAEIAQRGKTVLFVGGTPLYLKALIFGLFEGPPADEAIRQRLTAEAERDGAESLHRRLQTVDPPAAAKIHANDVRRVIRALEVFERTGQPISARQTEWMAVPADQPPTIPWINWPRAELYERIDRRVEAMFAEGLVEEVRHVTSLPKPLSREAGQALGYREVGEYLAGRMSLAETIAAVKTHSRQFAKRQVTWFRHLPGCFPVAPELTGHLWHPTI